MIFQTNLWTEKFSKKISANWRARAPRGSASPERSGRCFLFW